MATGAPIGKLGVRIERPESERVNPSYYVLMVLSVMMVLFTVWILGLEWAGVSLPSPLRM